MEGNQPGVGEVRVNQPLEGEIRLNHPEGGVHVLIDKILYEFHGPQSATSPEKIQIVFFHGLERGNSSKAYLETWKSSDGSTLWPKSWLGEEFKNSRILSVSYDSSMKKGPHMGRLDLHCTAENLIQDLKDVGVGVATLGSCPIVMVGKDLGCLVIQAVCVHASDTFLSNLRSLFFYCPPTMGVPGVSKALDGDLAQKLRTGDKEVSRIISDFWKLRDNGRWKVTVMNAAHPGPGREPISGVPEASARPGADVYYTAKEDILSICRPTSNKSISYIKLKNVVSECLASKGQVHQVQGLPRQPVGLMESAKKVEDKLRGTCVLGIFGMGGIGKTTLAKQLFNNISWRFEYTCFAEDVKGFKSISGLEDHVKRKFYRFGKLTHSIGWTELARKKILLVMDDIDSEEQLKFLPSLGSVGEGSVIVLTTRNQEVLNYFEEFISHEVDFLDPKEAERLFCRCAFRQNNIPESLSTDVRAYAQDVIAKCDRLPLTLEVLGAYLHNHKTDPTVWMETISRLENADSIDGSTNDRVWSKLKVSYDTLAEAEKEMFIDIAVFLVGESLERVLAACSTGHGNPKTRWNNLVSRCLVKSEVTYVWKCCKSVPTETVWMHEHLLDLGNKLSSHASVFIRCGSKFDIFRPPRHVFGPQQTRNVDVVLFSEKDATLQVRKGAGIIPRYYRLEEVTFSLPRAHFQHVEFLDLHLVSFQRFSHASPSNLRFLRWSNYGRIPFPSFPSSLAKAEKLAVLVLDGFEHGGQLLQFPKSLRILSLCNIMYLDCLPEDFGNLSSLKVLELERLNLTALPESLVVLSSLVTLEVIRCDCLDKLPENFGRLTALAELHLCTRKLRSLPDSFALLKNLQELTICSDKLHKLPDDFGQLHGLRKLRLVTPKLLSLSDSIRELTSLKKWTLKASKLKRLPDSIGELFSLEEWTVKARSLESLPHSIGGLTSLKEWTLNASSLTQLPDSIGELTSLKEWTLNASSLTQLPDSIGELFSLKEWTLKASNLLQLPNSIGELSSLEKWTLDANRLERLPHSIGGLTSLKRWTLKESNLVQLPDSIGKLSSLEEWTLDASIVEILPPSIGELTSLRRWALDASSLVWLPHNIGGLSSLEKWTVKASRLESLPPSIGELSSLKQWTLSASSLKSLPEELGDLSSLKTLMIYGCHKLRQLPNSLGCREGHKRKREERTDDSVGSSARQEMLLAIDRCEGLDRETLKSCGWTKHKRQIHGFIWKSELSGFNTKVYRRRVR